MFLKQIKMLGFKSFVESTTLLFNAQKIAIVGPNGCGKSNVIDAIRWVMGESSARFLRGDMMSDVIFNGSLHRKALGLASVEMILDNSEAYLQGPYVKKGDVSLKREINRAGESTYYINHQKVRRKDLTDLWLGTGAGARGYAIIGQNMVNQLVEANPDVLKLYLEEAAGVSKYKERRQESANRLTQTADNLSRIADMLGELEQNVLRLEKESQDALRFQGLRQELRDHQTLLQRLMVKKTIDKQSYLQKALAEQEMLEQASMQETAMLEQRRLAFDEQWRALQSELVQMEQTLYRDKIHLQQQQDDDAKRQQEIHRYQQEKNQLEKERFESQQQQHEEHKTLQELEQESQKLQVSLQETQSLLHLKNQQRRVLQEEIREQQQQRSQIRQKQQQYFTQLQVLKAKQEQTLQMLSQMKSNIEQFKQEYEQLDCEAYAKKIANLEAKLGPQEQQLILFRQQLAACDKDSQISKALYENQCSIYQEMKAQYDGLRQDMLGKEAAYLGLLSSYVPQDFFLQEPWQTIKHWLATWKIPHEWQKTVDWLWQHFLPNFYCQTHDLPDEIKPQSGVFYARMQTMEEAKVGSFLQKMQIDSLPAGFLNWGLIHVADDLKGAKALLSSLQTGESVLCPDGIWLGHDWIYYLPIEQATHQGLATRLNEWRCAQKKFEEVEALYLDSQQVLDACRNQYQQQQIERENQFRQLEEKERLWFEDQQLYQTLLQQHQFLLQEQARKRLEWQQAEEKYAQLLGQVKDWQVQMQIHENAHEQEHAFEKQISDQLGEQQRQFAQIEIEHAKYSQELQAQHLDMTRLKTRLEYLQSQHPKTKNRLQQLTQKIKDHDLQLERLQSEIPNRPEDWAKQVQMLAEKEKQWQLMQKDIEHQQAFGDALTKELDHLKNKHLHILEKKWKLLSEKEQNQIHFEEMQDKVDDIQNIPPEANESVVKKHIQVLEQHLQDMGDVNLLALGLYEQEKERQTHLFEQQNDLKQAIAALDDAVHTLDNDMQMRLQETLTAINQHLTEIFPQLFGGGEAKFVASCDNLLEASVAVHVQLPGKKPHRIQLLSGGEKALTAVALLFSIFSLNPAPFCLLDEVDAALDDANVQRLAGLIDKLSSSVQFMLITHNPLTMDVADELIGVTMQEPGVSRVVSVNMAKALEMVNKE